MRVGLKVAIVESGHTQREIAAEIHIPEGRLSSIVRGWTEPRPAEREALRELLHVGDAAFKSTLENL